MTTAERISRLEGAYEHLVAKADLADLKLETIGLKGELLRWLMPAIIADMGASAAIGGAVGSLTGSFLIGHERHHWIPPSTATREQHR